jgi:beta-carotene 3-hydroxylase
MEFVAYLAHRYVYHKLLWVFHKSHHSPRTGPFEANDVFPVFFATVAVTIMLTALTDPVSADLLAVSIGVSLYGMIYLFIHDLYVHRRMKGLKLRIPFLIEVKKAHALHHRYGGEPYGLLFYTKRDRVRREVIEEDRDV